MLARLKARLQGLPPWLKRTALVLSVLFIGLPLAAYVLLLSGGLTPLANFAIGRLLAERSVLQLRVGSLRSDGLRFLEADDLVLLAPVKGAKLPLLTVASLRLEFDSLGAWRGRVPKDEALKLARIRGLNIFVLRDREGAWNTSVLLHGRSRTAKAGARPALPPLPAGRVELEDSQVVFNDESKGFHSNITHLQGSLDTRALPLIAFSLVGRTEGLKRDNLSLAGESDLRDKSLDARLDLAGVELKDYLNYFLPGQGLRFEAGQASLSVRLQAREGQELLAVGRADLEGGRLRIPGVAEPLSEMNGRVSFDPSALRFKALGARFLGSQWSAEGGLNDLRHPRFDVRLKNPALGLQALSEQVKGLAPLALSGAAEVNVSLAGPPQRPLIQGRVSAPWVSLGGVELQGARADIEMLGPRLTVNGLKATVWDGSLDGNLNLGLGRGGHIQADMVLDGVRLEQARIRGQRPLPISGTAFVELKLRGLLKDPDLEGHLELEQAHLGELPLGKVEADGRWTREDWESSFQLLDGRIRGSLAAVGRPGTFKKSVVRFQNIDLGRLTRGLATAPESRLLSAAVSRFAGKLSRHLQGQADFSLSLEGSLKEPMTWLEFQRLKGQIAFSQGILELANPKQPLELEGEGLLGFGGGDLLFGRLGKALKLKLSHRGRGWEAQALGRFPLRANGRPGALELSLDGDLRLLDAFALFSRSGGRLVFDGNLGGTLDAPQARGELKVDDFSSQPEAYLAPIKDGSLRARLLDQVVDLPQLRFRAGGQVEATGRLDLSGGLKALTGELNVKTDQEGLRFQNWEGMGSANVVLDPLRVRLEGESQPLALDGRIKLSNAVIVYAGRKKLEAGEAARRGRGLNLDLRVGLGANVWYEKLHDRSLDSLDPAEIIKDLASSAVETLQRPDLYFRLRPTEEDFLVRGTTPDVELRGQIGIDRGRMTLMENEFDIKTQRADGKGSRLQFVGNRADVWAEASARLRYMRDDPLTGRPIQKAVNVIVDIHPLEDEDLERSDLAGRFLNYKLDFRSDPPIMEGNKALNESAVLNLVVLGDPMVDQQNGGAPAQGPSGAAASEAKDSSGQLISNQIGRVLTGWARKFVSGISKKGFKSIGNGLFDVFRVVPRVSFQSAAPATQGNKTTAIDASNQAREGQFSLSDLTIEAGRSVGEKTYGSVQLIFFGESTLASQAQSVGNSGRILRDRGVRAGLEHHLSPNRTLELFYNYSVDDNMEPVPFDPGNLSQAHSGVLRLRNTLPTGTYSPALSRQRRWGLSLSLTPSPTPQGSPRP